MQFLKCQLPKSVLAVAFALKPVLAAALGHLTHPSLSAYCSAPIAASCTACEIAHLGSCHLGNCHLGSRTWENALGKVPKTKKYIERQNPILMSVVRGGGAIIKSGIKKQ